MENQVQCSSWWKMQLLPFSACFFCTSCACQVGTSDPIYCEFPLSIISSWLARPVILSCVLLFPFAKLIAPDNSFRPMRWDPSLHPVIDERDRERQHQTLTFCHFAQHSRANSSPLPPIPHLDRQPVILNEADSCLANSVDAVLEFWIRFGGGLNSRVFTL